MLPESSERIPWTHVVAIGLAVAVYAVVLPFSIMHLDLARDISHGLAIARGERFPLEGPILASSVHAGPAWYYLLALPLTIGSTWLGVTLLVGALAALKFPLAYVVGSRLVDRRTGLLWALLLLYPGWMTFEAVVQNHASLVATLTLAVLVAALRYLDAGSRLALGVAGLLFGLALHAHPSAAGLGLLLVAAIGWRARRDGTAWLADLAIVGLGAIVPFAPYLWSQASSGFPDFTRAAAFVGDPGSVGSLVHMPALLGATFVGGGQVVASDLVGQVPAAPDLVLAATLLVLFASACGIVAALNHPVRRATIIAGLTAVLVLAASVAAIRAVTPFYMTFVVWTIAAGVLAAGLRFCERLPIVRWVAFGAIAVLTVTIVTTQAGVADTLRRGAYPFEFFPLFDVKARWQPGAPPMPFLVARASSESGQLLCDEPSVTAHGSYAVHLFHVYALEAQLGCGRNGNVALGGTGGPHKAGVSDTIASRLGFTAAGRLGPLLLLPVAQVVSPTRGAPTPPLATYPPIALRFDAPAPHVFDFEASQGEAVLVTDMYFAFVAPPAVTATANGAAAAPVARDRVSTAFQCTQCQPGSTVKWRIQVTTPAVERVDIVTVRSAAK